MINLNKKRIIHEKVKEKVREGVLCEKVSAVCDEEIEKTKTSEHRKKLNPEQSKFLKKQTAIFNRLKSIKNVKNNKVELNEVGEIVFEPGTLFHGTRALKKIFVPTLVEIEKSGILALNYEEEEVPYCASFFKLNQKTSFSEFSKSLKECYQGAKNFTCFEHHSRSLVFIVKPNKALSLLTKNDLYDPEFDGTNLREILEINTMLVKDELERVKKGESKIVIAAIPYGIPSNFFSGIVVGAELLADNSVVEVLIDKFPHCYLVSSDGNILYHPDRKKDTEILESARKKSYGNINFEKAMKK
jgi:hypothetical protein